MTLPLYLLTSFAYIGCITRRQLSSQIIVPLQNAWYRKYHSDEICLHLGVFTFELYNLDMRLNVSARVYLHGKYIMDIVSDFRHFNHNPFIFCTYEIYSKIWYIFTADGMYHIIPTKTTHKMYEYDAVLNYNTHEIQILHVVYNTIKKISIFDIKGRLLDVQIVNNIIDDTVDDIVEYNFINSHNDMFDYEFSYLRQSILPVLSKFVKHVTSLQRGSFPFIIETFPSV